MYRYFNIIYSLFKQNLNTKKQSGSYFFLFSRDRRNTFLSKSNWNSFKKCNSACIFLELLAKSKGKGLIKPWIHFHEKEGWLNLQIVVLCGFINLFWSIFFRFYLYTFSSRMFRAIMSFSFFTCKLNFGLYFYSGLIFGKYSCFVVLFQKDYRHQRIYLPHGYNYLYIKPCG